MKESRLKIRALETPIFKAGENLAGFVISVLEKRFKNPKKHLEGHVLALTSKIMSLSENRLVPQSKITKETLVKREADQFLGEIGYGVFLTIKEGLLIASAGIDESNSKSGAFILYPKNPWRSTQALRKKIAKHFGLKRFGVLLTDSKTTPLRVGVTGVALAYSGFSGVESKIGKKDLFGRKLKMTQIHVADALAAAAVLCMGESNEARPLAVLSAQVRFLSEKEDLKERQRGLIAPEEDLYRPLLASSLRTPLKANRSGVGRF